ncbi:arylphorin subunit A4-like [Haematobia irritans]|uniref:arylphorin subunit A4-like n=1 Tax=Haematobia irritans TaxID=7368 RepID=UPI003F5011E5
MKIEIALLALVAVLASKSKAEEIADKISKQKFLFEIVYRIEEPLVFEDYIKLAKSFNYHQDDYKDPQTYKPFMDNYYKAFEYGLALPKGEFYGVMIPEHQDQLRGLFGLLYFAKNWEIFQRNACWARLYANEGLFVQALTLAVIHRDDFQGHLMMPSIYEIFPQYFLNNKFIYKAKKMDFKTWSKLMMYEKDYKDILYRDQRKYFEKFENYEYFYTKDWKVWQWWKLMGLSEQWYEDEAAEEQYLLPGVKHFWMPVDYSREVDFHNKESALSYFTEDLEWNAYYYYFNMALAPILEGTTFALDQDRRGEYFVYGVRQILARYYLERLSHGYGEIPTVNHHAIVEHGYNPQLLHHNGLAFSSRHNDYDNNKFGNQQIYKNFDTVRKRLSKAIENGFLVLKNGTSIDLRQPSAIGIIGNMMQGNVDGEFGHFWLQWVYMYFAGVQPQASTYEPEVFLNFETLLRDPLFYMSLKKLPSHFYLFHEYIEPYTREDLLLPGVSITQVQVSKLLTYFDLHDYDVSNLVQHKITFIDGEFKWDKILMARQSRLNHKNFDILLIIESEKFLPVVIRTFLGPKYDEHGRVISLKENRKNIWELDKGIYHLSQGTNHINITSTLFRNNAADRLTYSQRYHQMAHNPNDFNDDFPHNFCGFPDHLILPRGWPQGMPMQLFFIVSPYHGPTDTATLDGHQNICNVGSGKRHLDDLPFGYPFDREINEYEFFTPNMFFKDVKIYHEDLWENFYGKEQLQNVGTFNSQYYREMAAKFKERQDA